MHFLQIPEVEKDSFQHTEPMCPPDLFIIVVEALQSYLLRCIWEQ